MASKIKISIIFSILFFVNNSFAETKEFCANKWPEDYQMRRYCEDQQLSAKKELFFLAESKGIKTEGSLSASTKGNDFEKIIYRCMSKWEQPKFKTYDFTMVTYCTKNQFEAYEKTVNPSNNTPGISAFCANKWIDDFKMREYCENQQIEANKKLFYLAEEKGLVKNDKLSVSPKGNDFEKIILRCMNKWREANLNTFDFKMVVYCIENQFEAYRQ